jgi:hypothetical protein
MEKFLGIRITAENRNAKKEYYERMFMNKILQNEETAEWSLSDKKLAAKKFAQLEVNRETKHYRAWLKGKKYYTFHKNRYAVLEDGNEPVYASDILFKDEEE